MTGKEAKEIFASTLRQVYDWKGAEGLLYWDMQTVMPPKGAAARAQVLGTLSAQIFALMTGAPFGDAIRALRQEPEILSPREARALTVVERSYNRFCKIPAAEYEAFSVLTAQASHFWMRAKTENDYHAFAPYLQQIIDASRRFVEYLGYEKTPYDAMLEEYDPALLTAQLDPLLARVLDGTRALLAKAGKNTALPPVRIPADKQHAVGLYLLREMGYDLDAGNLFTTEHPFTASIHAGDTRVTTKYYEDLPMSSIFSVLHEGGHGMYDQNIDPTLSETGLRDGASLGIHESQSRFWENIVGRSRAFWDRHLEPVNALCGTPLCTDTDTFFRAINAVRPSFIRIEADELTYNLHIIIRYEIEKAIFNNQANSGDLPALWADKYEEYLGIRPKTYAEGVLQDSHWSGGSFGYFPSYTIGNLCAAQFAEAFEAEHGSLDTVLRKPDGLSVIAAWQKEKIHRVGAEEEPDALMRRVCGTGVDPECFLRYMERKLVQVYASR